MPPRGQHGGPVTALLEHPDAHVELIADAVRAATATPAAMLRVLHGGQWV